jgi:hypothetical protein
MSKAEEFWQYAEESMLSASQSKTDDEKQALLDLARTWSRAALQSESAVVVNCSPRQSTGLSTTGDFRQPKGAKIIASPQTEQQEHRSAGSLSLSKGPHAATS